MTQPFAFLVHPRARLAPDMGLIWGPLARVPEGAYDAALRRLSLPTVRMARVRIADIEVGQVLLVPYGARHMLDTPKEGRRRVVRAVDAAARQGARTVGLGALTAVVTGGGLVLRDRTDVGITNGNAFTAAVVDAQVRDLLDGAARPGRHVAVVGASGSVGTAVTELLARDRAADRFTLVARSRPRLQMLADRVGDRVPTTVAQDVAAARDADLVVLLTASADALLRAEHLAPGAVVVDATQPRNTSPELLRRRPDVTVVDGGIVDVPSLRFTGGGLGLPRGQAFACFAETALLALAGHDGHFCIGAPTTAQVDHVRDVAAHFAHLGFRPAAPTSFGVPLGSVTAPAAGLGVAA